MAMFADTLSNYDPSMHHKIPNWLNAKQCKIVCLKNLILHCNIIVTLKTRDTKAGNLRPVCREVGIPTSSEQATAALVYINY